MPKPNETSSEPKFTPGPWHATEVNAALIRVTAPGLVSGGSNTVVPLRPYHSWLTDKERANARLIAQAPALYDLARAILNDWHGKTTTPFATAERRAEQARIILAAIEGSR